MSNIWASGKAREEAHFFRTMLGIPSGPVDSEELRPSKVILTISGVKLTSFISEHILTYGPCVVLFVSKLYRPVLVASRTLQVDV